MLRNLAWNTFKSTGNIDTLMELLEVKNIENNINNNNEYNTEGILGNIKYGYNKDERDNNFRK